MLALSIGRLAYHALRHGAPSYTPAILLLGLITPVAFSALAAATHVQLMPIAIGLLYLAALRSLAASPALRPITSAPESESDRPLNRGHSASKTRSAPARTKDRSKTRRDAPAL